MFLIFNLGRENIFSYGDAGLKNGIKKLYSLSDPTADQIAKIIQPWEPYRSYGCIALWHSLDNQ
jgi:DNA-3-methyladenine glycosylase II